MGKAGNGVSVGPDLNATRSPVDKKLYRQIMLSNGLRVVLVCDTTAMHQEMRFNGESESEEEEDRSQDRHDDDESESESESQASNERGGVRDEKDGLRDAAAAMVVGVGSMYDPPEAQGLAHFLEHMLFMGTAKYPGDNAYDAFLCKHGGSDNAFTESEYTLYHLFIQQEKLFPALDMFAQFFIDPLMAQNAVEREMNAVESEFQEVKNSDQCRLQQVVIQTSGRKPHEHPFGIFSWGNLQSLRDAPKANNVDIMQLLRSFYNQYYFASNMALVVIGAYTLDKLQQEIEKMFSDIPSGPREQQKWPVVYEGLGTWQQTLKSPLANLGLPLLDTGLRKVYRMAPVRDRHTLTVTWQLPEQIKHWRSRPCDYISHLLGHESKGSILAALKKKAWATASYVGVGEEGLEFASSHALFTATFSLSEEGMDHWQDVVNQLFTYIGMLRYYCDNNTLPDWIFKELRLTHDMTYCYGDEQPPETCVENIAERMAPHFRLPAERILDGHDLLFEHNAEAVKDLLDNFLAPDKARIDILSSSFGRSADYDAKAEADESEVSDNEQNTNESHSQDDVDDASNANDHVAAMIEKYGNPTVEPIFGANYWVEDISPDTIARWQDSAQPQLPPSDSHMTIPPRNPFIPDKFDLKPLPLDDADHPLVNASLKLCVTIGKQKSWLPATVIKYNSSKKALLCSYEDEDEQWHVIDQDVALLTADKLVPGFEGSMDGRKIKFRLVALARTGEGAIMKFGDDTDYAVDEGSAFPSIPPPQPPSRLPKLFHNQRGIKMWRLQDRKFQRPIADIRTRLICANSNKTPLHSMCSDLFVNLVADSMTETSYLASVSDLGSSYAGSDIGITFRVNGFDDKLLVLYKTMLETLLSFRGRSSTDGLPPCIEQGRFEAVAEVLQRKYANSGLKASRLSTDIRIQCLRPDSRSAHVKSGILATLTEATFVETVADIMQSVAVETLFHGNVTLAEAKDACAMIVGMVDASGGAGLTKKSYPTEPVVEIPCSTKPYILAAPTKDPTTPNTAVEMYFQVGKDNTAERVMTDLLAHMMDEPFYKQLRTDDQIGYSVGCSSRWTNGIMGIYFYVVTSYKSATHITDRIERFLTDYRKDLAEMSSETFMEHLVGVAKQKLEMFNSLSEECSNYWSEIREFRYDWQANRDEAVALRSVTKAQIMHCFDKWLCPWKIGGNGMVDKQQPNSSRRPLFIHVIGTNEGDASVGRPEVKNDVPVGEQIDGLVQRFHDTVGRQTWGKVY